MSELERIKERFARRAQFHSDAVYSPLNPAQFMSRQERERALIQLIKRMHLSPVRERSLLEIGCGTGSSLRELFNLGFSADRAVGTELIPEYVQRARRNLPSGVLILEGDALDANFPDQSFDIVMQSTVFSSILDDAFQQKLAKRMWELTRPGGGILWYDFIYKNPKNPDVRGMPLSRVKALFPQGQFMCWRITLAPPLSRIVTKAHPSFYTLFNLFPFLRTHLLCWIQRPQQHDS